MTRINKVVMAAIAALALTTAWLAVPSQAFAGGGHGKGHGHHGHGHHAHGHHGHGHHGRSHHRHGHYYVQSCWKWTHHGLINICYPRY